MADQQKANGTPPGVFVVIAAFKLSAEWERAPAGVHAEAARELTRLLTASGERVCADLYVSRGLKASTDFFLRVRSRDLARAQRYSEVAETLVGVTKVRQYITAEKSAALDEQLNASSYQGEAPRFAIVIPVKKNAKWWNMPEEERRGEIEVHTRKSMAYLSCVKRELYHSTGLDDVDFITYFETADLNAFHELAVKLAATRENEFHTRWGQPTLVGTIQSIPEAVARLCQHGSSLSAHS